MLNLEWCLNRTQNKRNSWSLDSENVHSVKWLLQKITNFLQQRLSSRLILSILFPFYKWFNKFLSFITNDVLSPHSFEYTFFITWPHERSTWNGIFFYVTSMEPFNHQSPKNGTRIASHCIASHQQQIGATNV
jgi:hypothetical protein